MSFSACNDFHSSFRRNSLRCSHRSRLNKLLLDFLASMAALGDMCILDVVRARLEGVARKWPKAEDGGMKRAMMKQAEAMREKIRKSSPSTLNA